MKTLKDVTYQEICAAVKTSVNYREVFCKLGYAKHYRNGAKLRWLKAKIAEYSIDTSHLTFRKAKDSKKRSRSFSMDEIFCKDSKYRGNVRDVVRKENLIPYECAICGNKGEWNNKPLVLNLDHINGDHYDNRLENLRFLCPNCDRQQDTFGARNKKRYMECVKYLDTPKQIPCPKCGRLMERSSTMCADCYRQSEKDKSKCPSKEQLIQDLIELKGFLTVGKKYGVSDNTVRKWCKKYNLPYHTSDWRTT